MKALFSPNIMRILILLLSVFLGVKLFWFIVESTWLAEFDIDQKKEEKSKSLYYHVKLTPNEAPAPTHPKVKRPVKITGGSIKDIRLLAIYHDSEITVVTVEYKKSTKVLGTGESINGFILDTATHDFAVFKKNDKTYKISLIKDKTKIMAKSIIPVNVSSKKNKHKKNTFGKVTDAGDYKIVDRTLLEHYADHEKDIYKNIGIKEVKKGQDLVGFRITFVKRGTPFADLGIKRNDIIKSINGQAINSYAAAFAVYKNIKNVENLSLVIERGEEEMELEYEVN
ncbi:General secretion pathway protein C [hydrothermal vent metagenome]|uniref:General secretion pathway protein C n=1 Tax=hydrothermal vent metagenome TaxID=652676 RepID=A0A1W1BS62_9ZZZZ